MADKRVYAVTMRAQAEMVVWLEGRSAAEAKSLAEAGEYDVMSEWEPRDYSKVRAATAVPSEWPEGQGPSDG